MLTDSDHEPDGCLIFALAMASIPIAVVYMVLKNFDSVLNYLGLGIFILVLLASIGGIADEFSEDKALKRGTLSAAVILLASVFLGNLITDRYLTHTKLSDYQAPMFWIETCIETALLSFALYSIVSRIKRCINSKQRDKKSQDKRAFRLGVLVVVASLPIAALIIFGSSIEKRITNAGQVSTSETYLISSAEMPYMEFHHNFDSGTWVSSDTIPFPFVCAFVGQEVHPVGGEHTQIRIDGEDVEYALVSNGVSIFLYPIDALEGCETVFGR